MAARTVNSYKQGQVAKCVMVFRDPETGEPYDPEIVTFYYETPSGVAPAEIRQADDSGAVKRTAAGTYRRDLPLNEGGTWYYRFEGTGSKQGADQHKLTVTAARPIAA